MSIDNIILYYIILYNYIKLYLYHQIIILIILVPHSWIMCVDACDCL